MCRRRASEVITYDGTPFPLYPFRYYVTVGGLISYGPNSIDPIARAASYVDRILKGEKPVDLPLQVPTRYELIINLKTAKVIQ